MRKMLSPNMDFQLAVAEITSQPRWLIIHDYFFNANNELDAGIDLDITTVDLKKGLITAEAKGQNGTLLAKIEDHYSQHSGSRSGMFLTLYKGDKGEEKFASQQPASTDDILAKLKAEFPQYDTSADSQPAPDGQDKTHG